VKSPGDEPRRSVVAPLEAPLVGRMGERQTLDAALDDAATGTPCAYLIHGEAGVGKTRLVHDICEQARRREFTVLWGRCVRLGAIGPAITRRSEHSTSGPRTRTAACGQSARACVVDRPHQRRRQQPRRNLGPAAYRPQTDAGGVPQQSRPPTKGSVARSWVVLNPFRLAVSAPRTGRCDGSPRFSTPPASYLASQSCTVLRDTPNRAATSVTASPPLITANTT
jgi:hypothetical protein